jgi:hypothetical protein
MVYGERFWEDTYWSSFGVRVWRFFKTCASLMDMLGTDESSKYVELATLISKHLVEKLSEYVKLEEPESPGAVGGGAYHEVHEGLADFSIGKDPTVTLA